MWGLWKDCNLLRNSSRPSKSEQAFALAFRRCHLCSPSLCLIQILSPFRHYQSHCFHLIPLHYTTPPAQETPTSSPSCFWLWMPVGILKWVEFKIKLCRWSFWLMPTCGERSMEVQVTHIKKGYVTGNHPERNIPTRRCTWCMRLYVCMSGCMDVRVVI